MIVLELLIDDETTTCARFIFLDWPAINAMLDTANSVECCDDNQLTQQLDCRDVH